MPELLGGFLGIGEVEGTRRRTVGNGGTIFCFEGEDIGLSGKHEKMGGCLGEVGVAFPPYICIIGGRVESVLNDGGIVLPRYDARGVAVGLRPVGGIIGVLAGGIGQAYHDFSLCFLQQGGADTVGHSVAVGQANR